MSASAHRCAKPEAARTAAAIARVLEVCESSGIVPDDLAEPVFLDSEYAVLRAALLRRMNRSTGQFADYAGLPVESAHSAATRLTELGLIDWRSEGGYTDLRAHLEHELWPKIAARVAATPLRWSGATHAPTDRSVVLSEIDDAMGSWQRFRTKRPERFGADLDQDGCRAASLLWLGISGFGEEPFYFDRLFEAAHVLAPQAWSSAAKCFGDTSLRRMIALSLADSRTLPGFPPMLIVDRQRTYCGVCSHPVIRSEGRHITCLDSQLGEGLMTTTVPSGDWADALPFEPGCGVVWTHYTIRAWLAEVSDLVGPSGEMRGRIKPLDALPQLVWLDP